LRSGRRSTLSCVSESPQPTLRQPASAGVGAGEAEEVLDALPVLAGEPLELQTRGSRGWLPDGRGPVGIVLPAVQAAAVAAGGFVAGVAVVGLVHRHQRRVSALGKPRGAGRALARGRRAGAGRSRRGAAKASETVQIVGTRSLLVDVHLLGGSGDR
jgi:hypothetical protein